MPSVYSILRPALFRLPAETAHEVAIGTLARTPSTLRAAIRRSTGEADPRLHVRAFGIDFPHPVALAAGFDKAAVAYNALAALGFSAVEIGTVTAEAQPGSPRPRLFRLPADRALLNRMGFNNPGAEAVAARLARQPIETILGINLGKSKVTPLEGATEDYVRSLKALAPYAAYVVVNVSSPNTPGLRELQDARPLRDLVEQMVREARGPSGGGIPVLVKLAPDLSDAQLDEAVRIAAEAGAAGIIAVNTTLSRAGLRTPADRVAALGNGGISGAPLAGRADEVVRRIRVRTEGRLPIVGVGGIFTAEDAWRRILAGASLVQLYTGFIYEGPGLVRRIRRGLVERLERAGCTSLEDAVGGEA